MRDITTVINHLIDKVIPKDESENGLRERLRRLTEKTCYRAPEQQEDAWLELGSILFDELGQPESVEWKQEVSRIVRDEDHDTK